MTKLGALKIVMRYEWRMLKAERLAHLIALLFLATMSYAVSNGFAGLREQNAKAAAEERKLDQLFAETRRKVEEYERKLIAEGKSPDAPSSEINSAHLLRFELSDFTAVLPPNGFAATSVGIREVAPQAYAYEKYREDASNQPTVEARSLGGVFPEKQRINPLRMFTGRFDLAFATIFITPLLIMALSFNLIGADKESGILALMMTQGAGLPGILLGKTLVRFLLVFVCGVLMPGLAVYFGHLFFMETASLARLALWLAATGMYAGFWLALALLVNAFGRSPAYNALALAVCWGAFTILAPASINIVAETIFPPVPSIEYADAAHALRLDGNAKQIEIYNDFNREFVRRFPPTPEDRMRYQERVTQTLSLPRKNSLIVDFLAQRPEIRQGLHFFQLAHLSMAARELYIEEELEPILRSIERRRDGQERIVRALSFASPAAQMRGVFDDIAGTGVKRHRRFLAQFDQFVRRRDEFYLREILANANIHAAEFASLPRFHFHEETVAETLRSVLLPLSFLALVIVLIVLKSTRMYRRLAPVG